MSMSRQLFSFLFLMTMSGLIAFISRSVCIDMYHKIVTSSFSDTVWDSCSCHFDFVLMLNSLQMCKCRYVPALLCLCRYAVLASSGYPATIWSIVSSN